MHAAWRQQVAPHVIKRAPAAIGTRSWLNACRIFTLAASVALAGCNASSGPAGSTGGGDGNPPMTSVHIANHGRTLSPIGRMTVVGNFPTGGRLSPDGRFYWSVSAGHGENDVHVVDVASGAVTQVLPLPGSYGQMAFSPDGTHAYVSGTPIGGSVPSGPTKGDDGDVVHVFDVNPATGFATELDPIVLPPTSGGAARHNGFPAAEPPIPGVSSSLVSGPVGLAVTPDGSKLLVVLYNADKVAIMSTATGDTGYSLVDVGEYPFAVGIERSGQFAYVTNAYDGTLSKIDIAAASNVATITGVGGPDGDLNSQPQYVVADPMRDLIYVAVTNHDGIAVIDTTTDTVTRFLSLKRSEGYGSQPVAAALSPNADTLYVANAGENAVVSVALADRVDGSKKAFDVIGKIPTADYATDVQVSPDGQTLVWQAGRGVGAGPNPLYCSSHGCPAVNNDTSPDVSPYPSYVPDMLIGRVGILATPTDALFAQMTAVVDAAQIPDNATSAPADTPIIGAGGGASDQIKYVFYVVKENRTYDQIFGSDRRGNGDPHLQVLEDNCGPDNVDFQGADRAHPGCGVTPNQHAITRQFVLLDNFMEDSEVSVDGHAITSSAYATNYDLKSMHQDYSGRQRPSNEVGVFPVTFPPKFFLFDQAATQGITFRDYGEYSGGAAPVVSFAGLDDLDLQARLNDLNLHLGRLTYPQVLANIALEYASNIFNGCFMNQNAPNSPLCAFDCGLGCKGSAVLAQSRIDVFNAEFTAQAATCNAATVGTPLCLVPQFNYMIMMSDHTNGVGDGARDPLAMNADNDLGVGQLVDILSHSPIWPNTVVFVIEDDSQDGADHVDAHRAPIMVAGPYVKHGGEAIHTRYDQYSVIRTIELILGLEPLALFDAVATPMYDVFTATPDNAPYTAIQPEYDILATCPCAPEGSSAKALAAKNAALSDALPFNVVDRVPQAINDRILWQRVFGDSRPVPPPGPNASRLEHGRALEAMRIYEKHAVHPARAKEKLAEFLGTGRDD